MAVEDDDEKPYVHYCLFESSIMEPTKNKIDLQQEDTIIECGCWETFFFNEHVDRPRFVPIFFTHDTRDMRSPLAANVSSTDAKGSNVLVVESFRDL